MEAAVREILLQADPPLRAGKTILTGDHWWVRPVYKGDKTEYYLRLIEELEG